MSVEFSLTATPASLPIISQVTVPDKVVAAIVSDLINLWQGYGPFENEAQVVAFVRTVIHDTVTAKFAYLVKNVDWFWRDTLFAVDIGFHLDHRAAEMQLDKDPAYPAWLAQVEAAGG